MEGGAVVEGFRRADTKETDSYCLQASRLPIWWGFLSWGGH